MEMLLWLILGCHIIFDIVVVYWCWRCGTRAERFLQDILAAVRSSAAWSRSTATSAMHTKADVRYIGELTERHYRSADELRRQKHLQAVFRHRDALDRDPDTLPIPTPNITWIGDEAMLARRHAAMRTTDPLVIGERR